MPKAGQQLLGIDCGGTETKLILVGQKSGQPTVLRSTTVPTPTGLAPMSRLSNDIIRFLADAAPTAFAITVPGFVTDDGKVVASSNVPWLVETAPAHVLSAKLGIPGVCLNDGTAAAIAEASLGAGRGHQDIFVLTLGTGIAGAHIVDGQARLGAHGAAYEVGHVADGSGWLCSCGQLGCLETEIGGSFLGRRWDRKRGVGTGSKATDVVAAARNGDEHALAVLERATDRLARSMLGIVSIIDPGMLIIGGGLARSADLIIEPAVRKMRGWATFQQLPAVATAELGIWAGAWGAVIRADRTSQETRHARPITENPTANK